jgi:hypothetical protein
MSLLDNAARVESLNVLSRFRTELHRCLAARADALFELTDALLCTDGPVKTLVDLALAPDHRPPTAGPGWSSPATPSSASLGASPTTCAVPGRSPRPRAASPPPGFAAGSGTSTPGPPTRPMHQNQARAAPDAHPAPRTAAPAQRYDVGKTVKRDLTMTARQGQIG